MESASSSEPRDQEEGDEGMKASARITWVAAAVLLASCVAPSYISQRDSAVGFNGGFEIGAGGYPVNWTFSESPINAGDMIVSLDPMEARDGKQSLKMEVLDAQPAARLYYQIWSKPAFSARAAVVPGKEYRIAFWYKDVGAGMHMRWVMTSADYQQHFRHSDMLPAGTPTGEWQHVEERILVQEGEALIELIFVATSPGVFWCDDVRVEGGAETG
jgi:hypothetical protein